MDYLYEMDVNPKILYKLDVTFEGSAHIFISEPQAHALQWSAELAGQGENSDKDSCTSNAASGKHCGDCGSW
jgi:hypothetical protein